MTPEALPRMTKYGLMPDGEGWFGVSAREIRWRECGPLGVYCDFEHGCPAQLGVADLKRAEGRRAARMKRLAKKPA
jgi:hypothetical protein